MRSAILILLAVNAAVLTAVFAELSRIERRLGRLEGKRRGRRDSGTVRGRRGGSRTTPS